MAITAAELLVKVGWDSSDVDKGTNDVNDKVGKSHELLKTGAAAIGVGAVAAAGFTIKSMSTMQDAMVPIGTLVGTQSDQFKDLSAGISDMVKNSPDSPEDLGNSAYTILSSGITDTGVALKALQDATDLAGAGLGETSQATDLITSAMNSFKTEGLDSEKAAKTFFGTIASGKTTTAGLAQGFGAIAPLAATAGVKFNDLMAATAALTATGMPASQAYSGIKGALTGIIKPTSEAAEMSKKLGLEFSQQHLAAVGLPGFLQEVKEKTGGNVETMAQLFGSVEGLNSVLALTGGQSEAFASNLTNIAVAGENMAARAQESDETFSARFQTMKNKVMIASAEMGNRGMGFIMEMWSKHGDQIMGILNSVKTAFSNLFDAFKTGQTQDEVATPFERIGFVLRDIVGWVQQNWPTFQSIIGQGFALIQQAVQAVMPVLVQELGTFKEAATAIVGFFQEHWPTISKIITEVANTVMPIIELVFTFWKAEVEIFSQIWDMFGEHILSVLGWVFEHLAPIVIGALEIIQGVIKTFTALLKGDWSGAWEAIKQIFQGAWDIIKGVVTLAWDGLGAILKGALWLARQAVSEGWDLITGMLSGAVNGVKGMFVGMFDGIWDAFRWAINQVIRGWNGLHFGVPGFSAFGHEVGGFDIGVPRLNQLAEGTPFVQQGGFFTVGEKGKETAFLPRGSAVAPNGAGFGNATTLINVNMPPGSDGDDVVSKLRQWQRTHGAIPISVSG
jgi:TP901 family phage tail tape measure protein